MKEVLYTVYFIQWHKEIASTAALSVWCSKKENKIERSKEKATQWIKKKKNYQSVYCFTDSNLASCLKVEKIKKKTEKIIVLSSFKWFMKTNEAAKFLFLVLNLLKRCQATVLTSEVTSSNWQNKWKRYSRVHKNNELHEKIKNIL